MNQRERGIGHRSCRRTQVLALGIPTDRFASAITGWGHLGMTKTKSTGDAEVMKYGRPTRPTVRKKQGLQLACASG